MFLPETLIPFLHHFAPFFSQPTWGRFQILMASALLTTGRRTVANLLRTLGPLTQGHPTTYQRVFSSARWSGLQLACALTRLLLTLLPSGPVRLVGDDTVDGHSGRRVWGKARHRDPVRSSHTHTTWRYGHRWVVLAVLVRFPWTTREWALPVLVDLYLTPEQNQQRQRPHHTPAQLLCRLVRLLCQRFPQRQFLLIGDSGYGTHEVARFCSRHRSRLQLVSKFYPDANLFEPPPPYTGKGRPRVKGKALLKPESTVEQMKQGQRLLVHWYGGGQRWVEVISGEGHWYKSGRGLVAVRWAHVRDVTGTHREEYLYTTDLTLSLTEIISLYTARWNIETTFQEMRSHLGLESTQGWCRQTVLRLAPCLFGLYSVVAFLYQQLPSEDRQIVVVWQGKAAVTFSDAFTCVRRWLWREWVFGQLKGSEGIEKLQPTLRELLFSALAPNY